jgi:hypothetical protein
LPISRLIWLPFCLVKSTNYVCTYCAAFFIILLLPLSYVQICSSTFRSQMSWIYDLPLHWETIILYILIFILLGR